MNECLPSAPRVFTNTGEELKQERIAQGRVPRRRTNPSAAHTGRAGGGQRSIGLDWIAMHDRGLVIMLLLQPHTMVYYGCTATLRLRRPLPFTQAVVAVAAPPAGWLPTLSAKQSFLQHTTTS